MKNKLVLAGLALAVSVPMLAPETAMARRHYTHRTTYVRNCSGGNGAVGTVGGGVGGALIGNAVLGGPVGTIAGGVGGALLGRHLDKQHTRSRNGCRRR